MDAGLRSDEVGGGVFGVVVAWLGYGSGGWGHGLKVRVVR